MKQCVLNKLAGRLIQKTTAEAQYMRNREENSKELFAAHKTTLKPNFESREKNFNKQKSRGRGILGIRALYNFWSLKLNLTSNLMKQLQAKKSKISHILH